MGPRTRQFALPEFSEAFQKRFSDLEEIGSGGMARVFRARQRAVNRAVAIKLIHPLAVRDENTLQRFLQEARITAALQHPNIIKILDSGEEAELPYLVFELVEGKTLEERLRREGPLSLADALGLAEDLADALAYAHDRGIVHRDLKPENLLFTPDGTVKIADFGLARMIDSSRRLTGIGFSVGTPGYMSPEQVLGADTDGRSDIYSVGVMLYEMLTGTLPYPSHNDMNVMLDRMQKPFPTIRSKRPEIPAAVDLLVAHAMHLEVDKRFETARDLREAVLDISQPNRSGRRRLTGWARAVSGRMVAARRRGSRWMVPAAVAISIFAVAFIAAAAWSRLKGAGAGASSSFDATGVMAMPGPRAARIYWNSSTPYRAKLRYWEAGKPEASARELEEVAERTRHDLTVGGLRSGAAFSYCIVYPDGRRSLEHKLQVPRVTRLEVLEPRLRAAASGGAWFTWTTNVPARCWLEYSVRSGPRRLAASKTYRRRHQLAVPDYPLYSISAPPRLLCRFAGGYETVPLPVVSASEAATAIESAAARLELPKLVQLFDDKVRLENGSPAELLPEELVRAARQFEDLARAWFSEVPVARRVALYHKLLPLENVDAMWAETGLELPLGAAALYRCFVATDYPEAAPAGQPIAAEQLRTAVLRSARAPASVPGLARASAVSTAVVEVSGSLHLQKRELDAAERAWLVLRLEKLGLEEHIQVRVNSVLDLCFRPAAVGYPGMAGAAGEPATAPPARPAPFIAHSLPAELLRAGSNEFVFSYDSVPGVAALGTARVGGAWLVLEKAR
jgi:hypothetical protein